MNKPLFKIWDFELYPGGLLVIIVVVAIYLYIN
jgi:hypothetical protein